MVPNNRIKNAIHAEAIMDLNDVKTWARDEEVKRNMQINELTLELNDLREELDISQDRSAKGIRLMLLSAVFFSTVLAIVVVLSGILQIVPIVKGMF